MNCMTLNIKGIRKVGKVSWIKGMVKKFSVDFLITNCITSINNGHGYIVGE